MLETLDFVFDKAEIRFVYQVLFKRRSFEATGFMGVQEGERWTGNPSARRDIAVKVYMFQLALVRLLCFWF